MSKLQDIAEDGALVGGFFQKGGLLGISVTTNLVLSIIVGFAIVFALAGPTRFTQEEHNQYAREEADRDRLTQSEIDRLSVQVEKNETLSEATSTNLKLITQGQERMQKDIDKILDALENK